MQTVYLDESLGRAQLCHWDLDDMRDYTAAQKWTLTAGGSFAISNKTIGTLTPGASTNGEGYLQETNLPILPAAGKCFYFKGLLQYTEANVNQANVFIGLGSAMASGYLVNSGGGMIVTGQHFVFYKIAGGTTWQVESRNGSGATSTNVITNDTGITAGGSAYHQFEINVVDQGNGLTNFEATYKFDGNPVMNPTTGRPIVHVLPYSGSVAIGRCFGVKNGDTNTQTALCDYINYAQTR